MSESPSDSIPPEKLVYVLREQMRELRAAQEQSDAEIDSIQIALHKNARPWWLEPPVMVSVIAALVAILSTAYGIYQQREAERHNARVELREIIGQLKDNAELRIKYGATGVQQLGGYIDSENQLLADQAEDILNTFPSDISSTEFVLIGSIFTASGDYPRAEALMRRATQNATTPYDFVFSHRVLAQTEFYANNFEAGREAYRIALSVRQRYPNLPKPVHDGFDTQTLIYLAGSEAAIQQCDRARAALNDAEALTQQLPDYNTRNFFITQIVNYRAAYVQCQLLPAPVAPTPTP